MCRKAKHCLALSTNFLVQFSWSKANHDQEKLSSLAEMAQKSKIMSGSSHIRSVLIGIKYRNCRWTLDVYLHFAILLGQITDLNLQTGQSISYKYVNQFWLNLPHSNSKQKINFQSSTTNLIFNANWNTSNMRWIGH